MADIEKLESGRCHIEDERSRVSIPAATLSTKETRKHKKWYRKTSVTLLIAAALIVLGLGPVHVITGSSLSFPHIVPKHSFGYSETFISIDKITGMPWIAAKTKYPIGCRILTEKGYIESDEAFKNRIQKEFTEEMKESYKETLEAFDKMERQTETPLSDDAVGKLRSYQITYLNEVGIVAAGISFGEFLDNLQGVTIDSLLINRSQNEQTVVTIIGDGRTLKLIFACDSTSEICTITGGEIDSQEIDSYTALATMAALTNQ